MQYLVNGAQFAFSTAKSTPAPISAITNATPPVATTTAPPEDGEVVMLTSAWSGVTGTAVFPGNITANSFSLLGLDTSRTGLYRPGAGVGSFVVAEDFVNITQITGIDQTGGEANSTEWVYVDDPTGNEQSRPTNKSALVLTFTMHYDPSLPWHQALLDADAAKEAVVLREDLPSGRVNLFVGYIAFNGLATRTPNENQAVTMVFRANKWTTYAAEDI